MLLDRLLRSSLGCPLQRLSLLSASPGLFLSALVASSIGGRGDLDLTPLCDTSSSSSIVSLEAEEQALVRFRWIVITWPGRLAAAAAGAGISVAFRHREPWTHELLRLLSPAAVHCPLGQLPAMAAAAGSTRQLRRLVLPFDATGLTTSRRACLAAVAEAPVESIDLYYTGGRGNLDGGELLATADLFGGKLTDLSVHLAFSSAPPEPSLDALVSLTGLTCLRARLAGPTAVQIHGISFLSCLRELELAGSWSLPCVDLGFIVPLGITLTRLGLRDLPAGARHLPCLPHLRSLWILDCPGAGELLLPPLRTGHRMQLTELRVASTGQLCLEDLVAAGLTALRHLEVRTQHPTGLTISGIAALRRLPAIRQLCLRARLEDDWASNVGQASGLRGLTITQERGARRCLLYRG